jgi:TolB-like protein
MKNTCAGPLVIAALLLTSCATTTVKSSSFRPLATGKIAVMPLSGDYGEQAADMIGQELLMRGFRLIDHTQIDKAMRQLGYVGDRRFDPDALPAVGKQLGLKELLVGSITEIGGPLSSYPHVNISLRLVDVETGEVLWSAKYGNPLWSSATSTQGDIQRGAALLGQAFARDMK